MLKLSLQKLVNQVEGQYETFPLICGILLQEVLEVGLSWGILKSTNLREFCSQSSYTWPVVCVEAHILPRWSFAGVNNKAHVSRRNDFPPMIFGWR